MISSLVFLFGEPWALSVSIFERSLALTNFLAFLSFYVQLDGLIGSKGIAPACDFVKRIKARAETPPSFLQFPTIFLYRCDDFFLRFVCRLGLFTAISGFFGVFTGLSILITAVCYLSVKEVAGPFLGLQMHANLVETDAIYIATSFFLDGHKTPLVCLNWLLLFRVMMGGGIGKYSGGDQSWRDGTAMKWHYWTQPLPNPLSPFFNHLPLWLHKLEVIGTYVSEVFASLFVFAPQPLRFIPFFAYAAILFMINISGNYGHLILICLTESWLLLNDNVWNWFFTHLSFLPGVSFIYKFLTFTGIDTPFSFPRILGLSSMMEYNMIGILPWMYTLSYACISVVPFVQTFHGENPLVWMMPVTDKPLLAWRQFQRTNIYSQAVDMWARVYDHLETGYSLVQNFNLCGYYVKFGHMTKIRWEIIIEGSNDGREWLEYAFKYKPSFVNKRPPICPIHMPSLDWRLWFLPNDARRGRPPPSWFLNFELKLLEGEPCVLDLLDCVPFKEPPRYIRALLYDYRFTGRSYDAVQDKEESKKERHTRERGGGRVWEYYSDDDDNGSEDDKGSKYDHEAQMHGLDPRLIRKEEDAKNLDKSTWWWYRKSYRGRYGGVMSLPKKSPLKSSGESSSPKNVVFLDSSEL